MRVVKRCLLRLARRSIEQSSSRRDTAVGEKQSKTAVNKLNVRVFLAAFMIRYHSGNVFEQNGVAERLLLDEATQLVDSFYAAIASIRATGTFVDNPETPFMQVLLNYFDTFKKWKTPNTPQLVTRIENSIVALTIEEARIPADQPEDSHLRVAFKRDIRRLKDKLVEIGGARVLAKLEARVIIIMRPPSTNKWMMMHFCFIIGTTTTAALVLAVLAARYAIRGHA